MHIISAMNTDLNYPLDRDQVINLLKSCDISPTRQRIEVASILFSRAQHLSAEDIFNQVNSDNQSVSRATIYNTLGLFSRMGLVREVLIDRERVFYDSNNTNHNHVYNVDSGELYDINFTVNTEVAGLPEDVAIVETDTIIRVKNK